MMRKAPRIDYTAYSSAYEPGKGECWDFPTARGAKNKARSFGRGATIIRNFNLDDPVRFDWWQQSFFWVWDGEVFLRRESVVENKWVIPDEHWQSARLIRRLRTERRRPPRLT
jgi:hypothetical protein